MAFQVEFLLELIVSDLSIINEVNRQKQRNLNYQSYFVRFQ